MAGMGLSGTAPVPGSLARYIPIVFTIAFGCAASIAGFLALGAWDEIRVEAEFRRLAGLEGSALRQAVAQGQENLTSLRDFHAASRDIERTEFRIFTGEIIARRRSVEALAWVPRVRADEVASYEARARADGLDGYRLLDREETGHLVPTSERPEYFPVYYLEPPGAAVLPLGLDLAHDPFLGALLAEACDAGTTRATPAFPLSAGAAAPLGVLGAIPVYSHGRMPESVDERRAALRGFFVEVCRVAEIFTSSVDALGIEGVHSHLFEATETGERVIYDPPSPLDGSAVWPAQDYRGMEWATPIEIPGGLWVLRSYPTPGFLTSRRSYHQYTVLVAGLLFTALLASYLLFVVRHTHRLALVNREVADRLAERQRAEAEARREREFSHLLLQSSFEGVLAYDRDLRYTLWNPAMERLAGMTRDQVVGRVCTDIFPFLREVGIEAIMRAALEGRTTIARDRPFKVPGSGKQGYFEACHSPLVNPAGEIVGGLGLVREVTDRKLAEDALRASEDRIRTIVQNSPIAFWAIDRDGKIALSEGKGLEGLGVKPGELVGRNVFDLYKDQPRVADLMRRGLAGETFAGIVEVGNVVFDSFFRPINGPDGTVSGLMGVATDITERARAEAQLRATEERIRTVVTNSPIVLFAMDREGRFTVSEGKGLEALGLEPGAVVGRTVDEVYRGNPQIIENVRRALRGESFSGIVPVGNLVFEAHYRPTYGSDGTIDGLIGVATDMTERVRAEERLRASEERIRTVITNAPILLAAMDPEGHVVLSEGRGLESLGRKPGESIGRSLFDIYGDEPEVVENLHRALAGESFTTVLKARNHSFEVHFRPIRSADGRIEGVTAVATDITERVRAEAALKLRVDFDKLILTLSTQFINLRPEGVDEGIAKALQAIGEFAGVDRSYIFRFTDGSRTATNTHEWCAPGISAQIARLQDLPIETFPWIFGRLLRNEVAHVPRVADLPAEAAAERHEFEVEEIRSLICVPMVHAGAVVGFLGLDSVRTEKNWREGDIALLVIAGEMFVNALEHKQAEETIRALNAELEDRVVQRTAQLQAAIRVLEEQKRRVEEAARAKSAFLANISHELRTPLNGIIGFADLMRDGKTGPISTEHQEYLSDILSCSHHLLQLINDLLDLSKIESGKMPFRPESVDLSLLTGEVIDGLLPLAVKKRIRVRYHVDRTLEGIVADASKLKQILFNYVSNALKFTPDGGIVDVRLVPEADQLFRIEVEDNGIGISEEDKPRLFREFEQLDTSEGKRHQGTGLGLALVRRIAEAQGGSVGVRSVPGTGSAFWAIMPRVAGPDEGGSFVRREAVAEPPPIIEATAAGAAPKGGNGGGLAGGRHPILVVDDNPTNLKFLRLLLAGEGYEVRTARNADETVAVLAEFTPRVILMDLQLPGVDGLQLTRQLKADPKTRGFAILAVTGYAMKGDRERALRAGCDGYLTKPIDAHALLEAMAHILGGV